MQAVSIILWLLFVATSILAGITLWVEEHPFRLYGFGVIILLSPTFLGLYFYRRQEFSLLLWTSIVGIILQIIIIRKLAESDS